MRARRDMSQNVTKFQWTKGPQRAAILLAENELSDEQIADEVGVTRRTFARWKLHPEFMQRVRDIAQVIEANMLRQAIAKRRRRVDALNTRWEKMLQVIQARADDPAMQDVPGGTTGLLIRQVKSIGFGENNTIVEEYAVDTGLLRELREHEKQAAQELGQWLDKHEHSGAADSPLKVSHEFDFDEYRRAFSEFVATGAPGGESPEDDGSR